MKIVQAEEKGFCFGVRRAIDLVEKAAEEHGRVETLGAIVHNQQVVEQLQSLGVFVSNGLEEVKGRIVAITSHGVGPQVIQAVRATDSLTLVDTTCPFVRKAQRAAKQLADAGFSVVIFGDPNHPEVRGVLGWGGNKARATTDWQEAMAGLGKIRRIGLLSQTTQSTAKFAEFTSQILSEALDGILELRIINTICDATSKRQECATELSRKVDIVLVVGGKNSANTRHLAQICRESGVTTYHIETSNELEAGWFAGRETVGITAGASTPDWVIEEVVKEISRLGDGPS